MSVEQPRQASDERKAELAGSLAAVRARIAEACAAATRQAESVTLIAVTKTYPASDVAALCRLGVTDVGESRDQEASVKVAQTAALLGQDASGPPATRLAIGDQLHDQVRWHFVGQVQRRKARSVARYADAVHSVDRPELVRALAAAVAEADRPPLDVFLQVSLDADPARGGAVADDVPALADAVAQAPQLRLRGVMAVAPLGTQPSAAFGRLAEISGELIRRHPGAAAISAGMSGDLEAAIACGATHVRVGTALLGRRPPQIS